MATDAGRRRLRGRGGALDHWPEAHNEERASAERLRVLVASQRYQVANYAGERWEMLLGYLEGKVELDGDPSSLTRNR